MQHAPCQQLKDELFAPLYSALAASTTTRNCCAYPDEQWLNHTITRCLLSSKSGRDFLQYHDQLSSGFSNYFESLKSNRHLSLITEIANHVQQQTASTAIDKIAKHIQQLDGYDIWSGDGHWHQHATHDSRKGSKQTYDPVGHLFGLNLRSGAVHHLVTCDQINKRKEHDISALKRLSTDQLRVGAKKGRKVIWIWDRAGIDFTQWHYWKTQSGIYFISREKENMTLDEIAVPRPYDSTSPINDGVLADEECATSQHVSVRRVAYQEPVSGKIYKFITSISSDKVPPGAIAQLYRMRWDIEKVFDDFKNKLDEQKAWATSENAKTIQALSLCLTYNILKMFERKLEQTESIINEAESNRRQKRMKNDQATAKSNGFSLPRLYQSLIRCTQISVKFIRWIRYKVLQEASPQQAMDELRRVYAFDL